MRRLRDPNARKDHPRSRGVYRKPPSGVRAESGSSPLARGLPLRGGPCGPGGRIIPARAGFTRGRPGRPGWTPDHPRSRGVYAMAGMSLPTNHGSSPLARGLLRCRKQTNYGRRIIPARAGFTSTGRARVTRLRDHPRSRGVYKGGVFKMSVKHGSSPLARGLRPPAPDSGRSWGIIPARAGFTTRSAPPGRTPPDHPRSRGVYGHEISVAVAGAGSSPLARGLPSQFTHRSERNRIIPARAGFTRPRRRGERYCRDHPRSRGVYGHEISVAVAGAGSSPLARGLLPPTQNETQNTRIIPARAGFTLRRRW